MTSLYIRDKNHKYMHQTAINDQYMLCPDDKVHVYVGGMYIECTVIKRTYIVDEQGNVSVTIFAETI